MIWYQDSRHTLHTAGKKMFPTYSVVDVTENNLTINTYRTDNDEKIDETFSITKSKGDVASLNKEIKNAESIVKQKNTYTTQSYRVFEQALAGAKKVAADKKATKSEVRKCIKSSEKQH